MAKKKEPFTGNPFKYTEQELLDRYCGTIIASHGEDRWKLKKATYTNEGVWGSFTRLRDSFRGLLVKANGFVESDLAHTCAQIMMDAFLQRRSRGKDVSIPRQVVPVNAAPDGGGLALIDGSEFKDGIVSENEKLRWIFENMQVEGVKPEDAPSAGAWALLEELRKDNEQRRDFYKSLWPKLLTKEDIEKSGKLQDDGRDVIELIKRLQKALPEEE